MASNDITKFVDGNGDEFNFRDPSKESLDNKVTSIRASSSASDDKYPSEKAVASAIEALDVSSVGGAGKYISAISESDGKISATATTMDTTPTANSTNAVTSGGIKTALDAKAPSAVTTEVTIATGDKIVISDASDSGKLKRINTGFDIDVSQTVLKRNGEFESVKEADLEWGGVFRTSKAPVENFALQNVFFGPKPSAISVEYSNNRTSDNPTWTDYGLSDTKKMNLLSGVTNESVYCGKRIHCHPGYTGNAEYKDLSNENIADQGLRITICCRSLTNRASDTDSWIYCSLKRILMKMSTQSAGGGAHCVVEKQNGTQYKENSDTWTTLGDYKIQGDSGWNSIPFDGAFGGGWTQTSNYSWVIRFTIWSDTLSANPNSGQTGCLMIQRIVALSNNVWSASGARPPMQISGVPYSLDSNGKATFADIAFTARKLKTNLARTADSTFNGSADQENIPVTGTLPIANGGTGATTKKAAEYAINGGMAQATATMVDNFQIVFSRIGSDQSATNGVFIYRTALTVWKYFKDKISSVLGLTETSYGGNAATATAFSSGTAKTKFDGIANGATKVEASSTPGDGTIKINGTDTTVYTHPTSGANTSKGDTTDQTPSFGHTFKALSATVDSQGHTTSLAEHTVTIPDTVVTGGNSGEAGLMSPADKDKVDALGTASTKDVPSSGDASDSQVVMGNDSRLRDARTPTNHASSSDTYGKGTTSNYGHVKLATGDMNGARNTDGVACSKNHTHSQYLTSHQDISGKVSKSGDTMTGALTIANGSGTGVEVVHGNSNINTELRTTRRDTGVSMWTGIGSGGERHGLYSYPAASGPNGDGWVTVTEANGLSSFKGKCDGYYGVYFGASSTLRAKKRLLLGYTNEQASQYERVHASAIIDVRMQSGSGSPGITMLLTISARGTSYFITRLHVLSHSGWDPSSFCPVLVNFNNNNKTAICLALATSKSSTTLKEFGYTDVKVLPINDCTGFSWEFAYDDVSFDSSYMFMFKPYSYPASVIGTAVGDSNTPVSVDSSGNFSTVDTVKNSLKWNGYDLVIGQAPTTPADNTIYIF